MEKVFVSWAGQKSLTIANGLRKLLKNVSKDLLGKEIRTWLSDKEIGGGIPIVKIKNALSECHSGIFIFTPGNTHAPWMYFVNGVKSTVDPLGSRGRK